MASDMSLATKELLGRVRQLVPPMLDTFHKGLSRQPGEQHPGRKLMYGA